MKRKFLPTIEDLIDRLSIYQLKEVKMPEHKEHYAQDIKDILGHIGPIQEGHGSVLLRMVSDQFQFGGFRFGRFRFRWFVRARAHTMGPGP